MTDKIYYRIMTWLGWIILSLAAIEFTLWLLGYYPAYGWNRLDSPMLALNMLIMVGIMKHKDEIIELQGKQINALEQIEEIK